MTVIDMATGSTNNFVLQLRTGNGNIALIVAASNDSTGSVMAEA